MMLADYKESLIGSPRAIAVKDVQRDKGEACAGFLILKDAMKWRRIMSDSSYINQFGAGWFCSAKLMFFLSIISVSSLAGCC